MISDIDPQMRYCPRCQDEYMPDRAACGVCGTALLTGAEMLVQRQSSDQQKVTRKGALTPDDDIITIFKASLLDMKRLEPQLLKENIGVLIWGDKPSCGKGCCGGGDLELRVRREDAQAALAIIDADFTRQTASHGIHSAVADYGVDLAGDANSCPACGCTFSGSGGQALTCPDCGLCFG